MTITCPHCKNDDPKMIEVLGPKRLNGPIILRCDVCSKEWPITQKV